MSELNEMRHKAIRKLWREYDRSIRKGLIRQAIQIRAEIEILEEQLAHEDQ